MPVPRGGDDLVDLGELWVPSQFGSGFAGTGNKAGRVAGAAGFLNGRDGFGGDATAGVDDFANAVPFAVPEIEEPRDPGFKRADVGVGEVDDMDIIADAGAVGSRVVGAEDQDVFGLPEGDAEDVGNEVGFDAVMFAEALGGTGGIEVTEGDKLESVDGLEPGEHSLEEEFGFAVRIDGILRQRFVDGNPFGGAIGGAGGAEHHLSDTGRHAGIEQVDSGGDVVAEVLGRVLHGFANQRVSGEVEDGFSAAGFQGEGNFGGVGETALDEARAGIDGGTVSFAEIVEDGDVVPCVEQFLHANRADIARTAGDECLHGRSLGRVLGGSKKAAGIEGGRRWRLRVGAFAKFWTWIETMNR